MKKIGLGISLLLFAVVFVLSSSGMELAGLGIAIVGLALSFVGYLEK